MRAFGASELISGMLLLRQRRGNPVAILNSSILQIAVFLICATKVVRHSGKILLSMIVTGLPRFRRGAIVPQIKTFAPKSRNDADVFFITIFVYKGQLHLDAFTVRLNTKAFLYHSPVI